MTLNDIAKANGLTLFEFFQKTYRWRWGTLPTKRNTDEDIRRYADHQQVPKHCEEYLRQFQTTTLPAQAVPS